MDFHTLWIALALVLIIEGLMPFMSPQTWRRLFEQVKHLEDGQIRFFGLCCIVLGVFVLFLLR